MTDFEKVKEALNRTRIEVLDRTKRLDPTNVHDILAIMATKLNEVEKL